LSAHLAVVLLVLRIFVLALGLFFTVQHSELLLELVVLHSEFSSDGDESAETVNVVLVIFVDFLVHF